MKTFLITGAAGFIGFHLSKRLLTEGYEVVGIDNINNYYDVNLKLSRLEILQQNKHFTFIKGNIADKETVTKLFEDYKPNIVVNLAAQAGVRYSITNPDKYIESNIVGFFNILEACRYNKVEHLLYASSSSVYGNQQKTPFSTSDNVDHPVSLYAATKKSNELMAYTYSHLYGIPSTGLRFFTVYGPWGRPDMAYFSFTNKMVKDETIKIFNNGDMYRDFTYIDDIIQGMFNMLFCPPKPDENGCQAKIYNIGNNKPEQIMDYFNTLERVTGMTMKKEFLPMQAGDVYQTYADVDDLIKDFNFKPNTTIQKGLTEFWKWYKEYYKIK